MHMYNIFVTIRKQNTKNANNIKVTNPIKHFNHSIFAVILTNLFSIFLDQNNIKSSICNLTKIINNTFKNLLFFSIALYSSFFLNFLFHAYSYHLAAKNVRLLVILLASFYSKKQPY